MKIFFVSDIHGSLFYLNKPNKNNTPGYPRVLFFIDLLKTFYFLRKKLNLSLSVVSIDKFLL